MTDTTINYGPRVNVHPDRQGSNRSTQDPLVKYLILHTSEQSGAEDPNDAEDLARYLESPGDRPSSSKASGRYGSSYHYITDTDRVLPCVVDTVVAYSAGGGNQYGLHCCLPVKAGQTRNQWLDAGSRPYIEQAARWIIDRSHRHGLPIARLSVEAMRAGGSGYADHWTVTRAFGKSTHTDVGADFPWDVLAADINRLTGTPPAKPQPPASLPGVSRSDPGWYWVIGGDSPWSASERIYRKPDPDRLIPTIPAEPGFGAPNHWIRTPGVATFDTKVQPGEGPYAVMDRMHIPKTKANLQRFYDFNGGPNRVLQPNDWVVFPDEA